jgi:hypothetical protein
MLPATMAPARRSPWSWLDRLAAPLAAASLLIALLSAGYAVFERQELQRTASSTAALAETLSIMYQPGRVSRPLSGEGVGYMAKGTVYLIPEGMDAVLVTYDLPPLARREVYQFWVVDSEHEERVSGGTFRVDERGRGQLIVRVTAPFLKFRSCGVTKEPAEGSPRPTGPRVLSGSL